MDLKMGPRSAQEGCKRLLKNNFVVLENRLKFGLVLGPILVDFGLPKPPPCWRRTRRLRVWKLTFFGHVILVAFGSPLRRPKRRPRGPKTHPRAPQEPPRGPQERPRRLQEGLKRPQEPVKRAQDPPKSSQEPPKTPTNRRRLRSPISMNPKGLASNRRMKKGGRAAVIPLGEVNPPPAA